MPRGTEVSKSDRRIAEASGDDSSKTLSTADPTDLRQHQRRLTTSTSSTANSTALRQHQKCTIGNRFLETRKQRLPHRLSASQHQSVSNLQHNRAPTPPMGNWLSTEPGSFVDTAENPIGQRDDSHRGGEKTEGKGQNRTAAVSYSGARTWGLEGNTDSATNMETGRPVIDRQPTGGIPASSRYDQLMSPSTQQCPQMGVGSGNPYQTPPLFSPIWPIDSAYGTGPVTASYCPETPQTPVTAQRPAVNFADDDVVIPPSGTVDPAKIDNDDKDTDVETP